MKAISPAAQGPDRHERQSTNQRFRMNTILLISFMSLGLHRDPSLAVSLLQHLPGGSKGGRPNDVTLGTSSKGGSIITRSEGELNRTKPAWRGFFFFIRTVLQQLGKVIWDIFNRIGWEGHFRNGRIECTITRGSKIGVCVCVCNMDVSRIRAKVYHLLTLQGHLSQPLV